jgi:hypothetical protein
VGSRWGRVLGEWLGSKIRVVVNDDDERFIPGVGVVKVTHAAVPYVHAAERPVQSTAVDAGEDYPARVALGWVPDGIVYVISRRFSAFALASPAFVERLDREVMTAPRAAFHHARKFDQVSVTMLRVHQDGTVDDPPSPSWVAPAESPAGWFGEVTATLEAHDATARARIRHQTVDANREYREEVARHVLPIYLRDDLTLHHAPGMKMRPSPHNEDWVNLNRSRSRAGRHHKSLRMLLLKDEMERQAVTALLRESGYQVREPLHGCDEPPELLAELTWIASWGALRVTLGIDGDDGPALRPVAALYFPPEQQLISVSDTWEPYIIELLAWNGLPVTRTSLFEPPDGYNPMLYDRLAWDMGVEVRLLEARARQRQPAPGRRRRSVKATARRLVPPAIADAVQETLDANQGEPFAPRSDGRSPWADRAGILTRDQAHILTAGVAPTSLPSVAAHAATEAAQISRKHLPLLAAVRLRELDPSWWQSLPWTDPPAKPRRGIPRSMQEPDGVVRYLGEMTPDQIETCAQPALVQLLLDHQLDQPDYPKGFTLSDEIRLHVAAAALLHAGLAADGFDAPRSISCAICDRRFPVDALTLRALTFTWSDRYCRDCAYTAESGSPERWTPVREAGALAAIRELAALNGGPTPRAVLAAPLRGLTRTQRTRHMLMRQILPPNSFADASIPAWGKLLADSGVLGEGWRPSYGTYTVAEDGHRCRSLMERFIDDFLSSHAIDHEPEPDYPFDQELNPRGGFRADWLIDGVLVEAAGMMGRAEYRLKMETKKTLAQRHGLELVIIQDADLVNLAKPFARWMAEREAQPEADSH